MARKGKLSTIRKRRKWRCNSKEDRERNKKITDIYKRKKKKKERL